MSRWLVPFTLAALIACASLPARAQQALPDAWAVPDDVMQNWLLVETLDRTCSILNYGDRVPMMRKVTSVTRLWSAERADSLSEDEMSVQFGAIRAAADASADTIGCDGAINYILAARRQYLTDTLNLILRGAGYSGWGEERRAIQVAWQSLVDQIGNVLGENEFNRMKAAIDADVQMSQTQKGELWENAIRPLAVAVLWQMRTSETGYGFFTDPDEDTGYIFAKMEDMAALPFTFTAPTEVSVRTTDDSDVRVLSATGETEDGSILVFVAKDRKDAEPLALTASLLISVAPPQDGSGMTRPPSVRGFDATRLPASECPLDFCFEFPLEVEHLLSSGVTLAGPPQFIFLTPRAREEMGVPSE